MSGPKPQAVKTPYEGNTTMTYSPVSISQTPEAKALMEMDLDIDPGVGRRGALRAQETAQRWDSAFMDGVPQEVRERNKQSQLREDSSQTMAEQQQAEYARKMMDMERRKWMLPAVMQTSGSTTGFGSEVATAGPSPWASAVGMVGSALIPKI